MRIFMYVVIVVVMLASYASSPEVRYLPAQAKFLPDIISMVLVLYIFLAGVKQRFRDVSAKYWLVFGALIVTMVAGALANQEDAGPILAGMRYYLRAIPLFLLPAVVKFEDRDLINYLKLILALSLLQAPVAVYQRITQAAEGRITGDYVFGTLMYSGIMSIFLIAVLCMMSALMLRGRMNKLWYAICFIVLVVPMSVNETKATMLLLPVGVLATFLAASPRGRRTVVSLQAMAVLAIGGAIFIPIYNYYSKYDDGTKAFTATEFITDPEGLEKYMSRNPGVGTAQEAGRFDSLAAPFRVHARDPIKLTFGVGIGNVSKSSLGAQFSGKYQVLYWNFAQVLSISTFLFEIGVLGTLLVLALHWLVLRDALRVARHDTGLHGVLALGYVGVWVTLTIGLFYITVHLFESLSFLFWFFSGLFAAQRVRMARAVHAQSVIHGTKARRAVLHTGRPGEISIGSAASVHGSGRVPVQHT